MTKGRQDGKDPETVGQPTPKSVFATLLGLQTDFASSLLGALDQGATPTELALDDGPLAEWNEMAETVQEVWSSLVPNRCAS